MSDFVSDNLQHVLALLILAGRLGDVRSTRMITPTLKLEANPVAKRFHRIIFPAGFLLCLVPYFHWGVGIQIAVCFLLVAASNFSRGWLAQALGEAEYLAILSTAAKRSSIRTALGFLFSFTLFGTLAGILMLALGGDPGTPGYWLAVGFLTYVTAATLHSTLFLVRLFRETPRQSGQGDRTAAVG